MGGVKMGAMFVILAILYSSVLLWMLAEVISVVSNKFK